MMAPTSPAGPPSRQAGFTYGAVLAMVLVMAITSGVAAQWTSELKKAEVEAELLFRGLAYQKAIESYYRAIPAAPSYPKRLEDLLNDPRFLHKRHLRQLYPDPTGSGWRIIRSEQGGIVGIATASTAKAKKKARFPIGLEHLENRELLREWVFQFLPTQPGSTPP